ncbi:MAG: diacylglycerol kinase family lipid kinase, partial [Clostridiaceae bacterium]|nr:diacylglycerol kinase family lipid kinase [Clostridiaceae bacterium]
MHHIFIVNPAAGKGRSLQMIEVIKNRFKNFNQTYEIKVTEAPGHAKELAYDSAKNNDLVRIYSVGGDGTLNEVVNGIAGSNAELGIIPCGSGNDAIRSIYKIKDPVKLIDMLPVCPSASVDLGKLNDRYFINIASIGFDA